MNKKAECPLIFISSVYMYNFAETRLNVFHLTRLSGLEFREVVDPVSIVGAKTVSKTVHQGPLYIVELLINLLAKSQTEHPYFLLFSGGQSTK